MPGISAEDSVRLKDRVLTSDVFLVGTNALSLHGRTANVDGPGNHVGATLFGPTPVLLVAGANRILGTVAKAPAKIKTTTAPLNRRRHESFDSMPPCSVASMCWDCDGP